MIIFAYKWQVWNNRFDELYFRDFKQKNFILKSEKPKTQQEKQNLKGLNNFTKIFQFYTTISQLLSSIY